VIQTSKPTSIEGIIDTMEIVTVALSLMGHPDLASKQEELMYLAIQISELPNNDETDLNRALDAQDRARDINQEMGNGL